MLKANVTGDQKLFIENKQRFGSLKALEARISKRTALAPARAFVLHSPMQKEEWPSSVLN